LFGLLASSGMRIGEAVALQNGDVDLGAGVITIRHAKFDRSRLLPLHRSVTEALGRYEAERDRLCPRPPSSAFFVSATGTSLNRSSVGKTLRTITTTMGIRTETIHPRVHDLRHSFAVRTLIDWQRAGIRIDERIGILSTYLGHISPADTYWYLSASPELMEPPNDSTPASEQDDDRARPRPAGLLHRTADQPACRQPEHDWRLPADVPPAADLRLRTDRQAAQQP
jgi:integrase